MRILMVNDGVADAGGVHTYLEAVIHGLLDRNHDVALLHYNRRTAGALAEDLPDLARFVVEEEGMDACISRAKAWRPEICFSHNMKWLNLERSILLAAPVIKMMHGYFGTCIGGQKMFSRPCAEACDRRFGKACLALYLPRGCGQFSLTRMLSQFRWGREQQSLFARYRGLVVASEHMKEEYTRNGADPERVHVVPLFPANRMSNPTISGDSSPSYDVAFIGRMTRLKGGDLLIRAVATASKEMPRAINLAMVGDGPQRATWEDLARTLKVSASFSGWLGSSAMGGILHKTTILALPSVWPEPFGLVGLEAAQLGVPTIAFDVGGIGQWLRDGQNGILLRCYPPTAKALGEALAEALLDTQKLADMRQGARVTASEMTLSAHLNQLDQIFSGCLARC